MGEVSDWDFFVSYTQADRSWAEWIAWILEEDGYRVLVQAWDFVPGTNWTQHMHDGTARAARTVAVLSDDYLESVYGGAEWQAAWRQDPTGAERRLIPVRVADCDRPGLLGAVVGIDLFGRAEEEAREALRSGVATATSGRGKPQSKPGFPDTGRAISTAAQFPGAMPSTWHVPARNPNFTGRDDAVSRMRNSLNADATVTVHSVAGLGGVGKTQLATEYAHKFASDYDVVWWIAAEEPAAIPDQFAALAHNLGLGPVEGQDELRAAVHHALRTAAGWLLVFDNADTVEDIAQWLPSGPMPTGAPGHVIVTTRRGGFRRLGDVLDLDVIDVDAAVRVLQSRAPNLDDAVAESIANVLGCLPLGLEQAAAYLDHTRIPPREYLGLLRTRESDMLTGVGGQVRDRSVATVWELSLDRIRDENPAGHQILDICAYLAPEAIPLDLFTNHPDLLPEPLSTAVADPLLFNNALATVVDYSMAKRSESGLQLHRLVQTAIRSRHPKLVGRSVLGATGSHANHDTDGCATTSAVDGVGLAARRRTGRNRSDTARLAAVGRAIAPRASCGHLSGQHRRQKRRRGCVLAARPCRHLPTDPGPSPPSPTPARTRPHLCRNHLRTRPPHRRHPAEQPRPDPARARRAGRGPPAGRTRPGHHRNHLRTRPPRRRHPAEQPRPHPGRARRPGAARPLAERALAITETTYGPDHPDVATR